VHGAHAGPESDGYAEAWWLPNANNIPASYATTGTFVNQFGVLTNDPARPGVGSFRYPNDQPSSTVWYHDHALGMTRSNVYAGPAGFWILRESNGGETGLVSGTLPGPAPVAGQGVLGLNVPGDPVRAAVREIPIAIQDRSFNIDGSLFYPDNRAFFEGLEPNQLDIPFIGDPIPSDIAPIWNPEAFFNTTVVNGVSWPSLEVEPDLYRFRLLNGCNSRFLNLALVVVNADGTLGAEVPFYQIGAEQSLLPKVVKIVRGDRAVLPGNGSNPPLTPAPLPDFAGGAPEETVAGLLMGNAERADVIVDFRRLAPGTRVRLINTGPDEPFGGFPAPAADPDTTGQVMEFLVGTDDTTVGEGFTPPARLVLRPVENVDTYPAGLPNIVTQARDQALVEEESILICVTIDAVSGAITYDPNAVPNPADPTTCILRGTTTIASSLPFGPKAAVLGINGASPNPTITLWSDPIATNPQPDAAGNAPTETWEFWNHTVDAHPIHVHEVKFKVLNREAFDPATGTVVPGTLRNAEATETGWKDTVIAYPGEVTRIAATFDLQGLYVWHCHIVEHEDNEMMVPYCIGNKDPALGPVAPGCILNEPPVAVDDAYSTKEDKALTVPAPGVLANDTDINANNILTAILVSGPANGKLTLNPDGSFTYTPNLNFNGTDSFTYKANDGVADSNVATVTITVTPVLVDMKLKALNVPLKATSGGQYAISVTIANIGKVRTSGTVSVKANGKIVRVFQYNLAPGAQRTLRFTWTAPVVAKPLTVNWLATVAATGDNNPANNTKTAKTIVYPKK
jgi:FtsP/CotA-like multicopper oxidase with cupredoxin domain